MKNSIWILLTFLTSQMGVSQTTETIAVGEDFGEIVIRNNILYRGGLEPEVLTYDLSNSDFIPNTIATGPGTNAHLRFAVDDTVSSVYLSEFGGPIFAADVSENNLTLIAQGSTTGGEVLGLAISGNAVYYATAAPQILRFAMNDPDSTLEIFFDPPTVFPIFNILIEGNTLYYSTQSDFDEPIEYQVFSLDLTVTNPEPQLVTTTAERAWTFAIDGTDLYLGSDQNNTIYLKDLSDGNTDAATVVRTLTLENNTNLYALDYENGFLYYSATGDDGGIFRIAEENLSVSQVEREEVTIFPNPSREFLNISGIHRLKKYAIISANGRSVLEGTVRDTDLIDIRLLSKGFYILSIPSVGSYPFIKK